LVDSRGDDENGATTNNKSKLQWAMSEKVTHFGSRSSAPARGNERSRKLMVGEALSPAIDN
jgi:hypothetical protein